MLLRKIWYFLPSRFKILVLYSSVWPTPVSGARCRGRGLLELGMGILGGLFLGEGCVLHIRLCHLLQDV